MRECTSVTFLPGREGGTHGRREEERGGAIGFRLQGTGTVVAVRMKPLLPLKLPTTRGNTQGPQIL